MNAEGFKKAVRRRLGRRRHGTLRALASKLLLKAPAPRYERYPTPVPVGWNLYRCPSTAEKIEPERWWHRTGHKLSGGRWDPFGRSAPSRPF